MGDVENIFCCKCRNALPDHVIFPCGHFVCEKCETITNCLICELPVLLIKSSFSLRCYRKMVTDGLLPVSKSGVLPTTEIANQKKPAKSPGVKKTANKRKPTRNSLTSADKATLESPAREIRSSPRNSHKKLIHQEDLPKQKDEKSAANENLFKKPSTPKRTEQSKITEKSGTAEESASKDTSPHVHPKKARLLRNCLSASKSRLGIAKNVEPDLNSIVKISSPPPKKRKTTCAPSSVPLTRLKTSLLQFESSDEDDDVFIESPTIVDCGNKVNVVAQVHASSSVCSQTSLDNVRTDESPIKYTQIGLGHLEQDKEEHDFSSADFSGFKSGNKAVLDAPLKNLDSLKKNSSSHNYLPTATSEKVQLSNKSNTIVDRGNTVNVVEQVHVSSSICSQTNLDNRRTDGSPIQYTQIGLGHLEQDKEEHDFSSAEFSGFENRNEEVWDANSDNLDSGEKNITCSNYLQATPEKVQYSNKIEMETKDNTSDDSTIKSSLPPPLQAKSLLKVPKVKRSTKKVRTTDIISLSDDEMNLCNNKEAENLDTAIHSLEPKSHDSSNSPLSNIKDVEGNSTLPVNCDSTDAAQKFTGKENLISDSIYSKDTESMDIDMEISSSCCGEDICQHQGETPADISHQEDEKYSPDSPEDICQHQGETPAYISHQEDEKYSPDSPENYIISSNVDVFEDESPTGFTKSLSFKNLEVPLVQSTSTNVMPSQSNHSKHDVEPPKGIVVVKKGEEIIYISSPSGSTSTAATKQSSLVFEDEEVGCPSFAAKRASEYLQDNEKISIITTRSSSESLHSLSDVDLSKSDTLEKTVRKADSPYDKSDLKMDTPNCNEDRNKLIDAATISSTPSLLQPREPAVITPPSSTIKKAPLNVNAYHYLSNISSQTSVVDINEPSWNNTYQLLTKAFSKIYLSGRPKSLLRLAFDALLLPLKNEDVFQGLSTVSPVTASAEKSVQVDLFFDQTTVKVELGKDPMKRNSFTRRQLSFLPESSSPKKSESSNARLEPEESEEIVEATPTKAQVHRVNLLNDSTCTPLNSTLAHEDSPAPLYSQSTGNETPAFSIFDPPPITAATIPTDHEYIKMSKDAHPSPKTLSNQQIPKSVSPAKRSSLQDAKSTPQTENFCRSQPPSSTPISSQPMDSSLPFTDSESIIGDTEQPTHRRKHHLALPLGGNLNKTIPKEIITDHLSSPRPFRNISNVFQITTTGIYGNVERIAIKKLCDMIKATFSTQLTKDTTHLILPNSDDVVVTTKFLMALYNGSFILPMRWVFDCIISEKILPEADYFFRCPGIERRMMMPRRAALFVNFVFYISPEIRQDAVNYQALKDLMKFCNCHITETVEEICQVASVSNFKAVVLRGADYTSSNPRGPLGIIQVSYQWFYSCLTAYEIQPFDKHVYN